MENLYGEKQDLSNLIWGVADSYLRGLVSPEKYKDIIIPMTVIRRLDCLLIDTKQAVKEFMEGGTEELLSEEMFDNALKSVTGNGFYNKSEYTLSDVTVGDGDVLEKFSSYLNGFSKNVKQIIHNIGFEKTYLQLAERNLPRFVGVLGDFANLNLRADAVENHEMGYLFEDLIRRFSENAEAGDHYTPREVIKLMCEIALNDEKREEYKEAEKIVRVYDGTCGTGGMLMVAKEKLREFNPNLSIQLFGQEINAESHSIATADMLISDNKDAKIELGDTLLEDKLAEYDMDIVLMNPPFGINWDIQYNSVVEEREAGGRFQAGLPSKSDGALLFLQHMVSKLANRGRGVIVHNGSPLFSGKAGSGESDIRKYLLENDMLEGVIALPTDMFYNTGIATYLWVISNPPKEERRKGKVQLVDARGYATKMRKALGSKRNELTDESIRVITKIYHAFEENSISKIYNNEDFMFWEIPVNQPMRRNYKLSLDRINDIASKVRGFERLDKLIQSKVIERLTNHASDKVVLNRDEFSITVEGILDGLGLKPAMIKNIVNALSEQSEDGEICYDKKGNPEFDPELKDVEIIPYVAPVNDGVSGVDDNQVEVIEKHLREEVEPHVGTVYADVSTIKVGAEIPFTRLFYKYEDEGTFEDYMKEAMQLEEEIATLIKEVFA